MNLIEVYSELIKRNNNSNRFSQELALMKFIGVKRDF